MLKSKKKKLNKQTIEKLVYQELKNYSKLIQKQKNSMSEKFLIAQKLKTLMNQNVNFVNPVIQPVLKEPLAKIIVKQETLTKNA